MQNSTTLLGSGSAELNGFLYLTLSKGQRHKTTSRLSWFLIGSNQKRFRSGTPTNQLNVFYAFLANLNGWRLDAAAHTGTYALNGGNREWMKFSLSFISIVI